MESPPRVTYMSRTYCPSVPRGTSTCLSASAARVLSGVTGLGLNAARPLFSLWKIRSRVPLLLDQTSLHDRVPPPLPLISQPAWPPDPSAQSPVHAHTHTLPVQYKLSVFLMWNI